MVKAYLRYIFDSTAGAVCGNSCALITHDKYLLSASGQYITQINRKTGQHTSFACGEKNCEITQICLINQSLAVGFQDGDILIWNLEDKKCTSTLYGHKATITTLTYSPRTHSLYSGSADNSVIVWDLIGEELRLRFTGHTSAVTSLQLVEVEDAHSAEVKEYVVSGAKDGLLKLWDMYLEQSLDTVTTASSEVLCLNYIESERMLVIGTNSDELQFRRLVAQENGRIEMVDEGGYKRNSFSRPLQLCIDNEIIYILTSDRKIETYKIKTVKKVQKKMKQQKQQVPQEQQLNISQLIAHGNVLTVPTKVRSMLVYQEKIKAGVQRTIFAISFARNVIEIRSLGENGLWLEEEDKSYHQCIQGNQAAPSKLYLSENDAYLLSLSGTESIIYEPSTGSVIKRIAHNYRYTACTFLPKNRYFLLGDSEGQLQVMDFNSGEEQQLIKAHQTTVNNIIFHPNPKSTKSLLIMTSGEDRCIKFWDVFFNTQTKKIQLKDTKTVHMTDDVNYASFSNNGDYYAISFLSNTIKVFYCDSHNLFLELYGHSLPVLQFSITSDNTLLISGGQDKTIKIWGMDFGDCRKTIKSHQDQITIIQSTNETHYFFSGSRDKMLKYWDGDTYELIMQFDEFLQDILSFAIGMIGDSFYVGSKDKIIRKYIQTKEQVYVQEEEDNRVDKMLVEDYQKNLHKQDEDHQTTSKQQVIQSKVPQLRSAEDVMNTLEQIVVYRLAVEDDDEITEDEKREKRMMFNYEDPTAYLLRQLQNIPATSIPSVLRFVHIKYLSILINELKSDIAINIYSQLTSSILNYLLINQEGQLLVSNESIQSMIHLKDRLHEKLKKEQEIAEFNMVAMDIIIKMLDEQKEIVEYD